MCLMPVEEKNEILFFICDRKACEKCNPFCHLTSDISHAVNFRKHRGKYVEEPCFPKETKISPDDKAAFEKSDEIIIKEKELREINNNLAKLNKIMEDGFSNLMNYMIFLERLGWELTKQKKLRK